MSIDEIPRDLSRVNMREVINSLKQRECRSFIRLYDFCSRNPREKDLMQCFRLGSSIWTQLYTLRQVLCGFQSAYFGDWLKDSPQSHAPHLVEAFEKKHGKEGWARLMLSEEDRVLLGQIEELFHPVSSLLSMLDTSIFTVTNVLTKGADRKMYLSQESMQSSLERLIRITNYYDS